MLFRDTVSILICDPLFVGLGKVRFVKNTLHIEHWQEIAFPNPINDPEEWLSYATQKMEESWGKTKARGRTYIVLPLGQEFFKWMRVPKVRKPEQENVLRHEIQQRLPYPLDDVLLEKTTINETPIFYDVLFSAAKKAFVTHLINSFSKRGIAPSGIFPTSVCDYYSSKYILEDESAVIYRATPHEKLITISYPEGVYVRKGSPQDPTDEGGLRKFKNQFEKQTGYPFPKRVFYLTDNAQSELNYAQSAKISLQKTPQLASRNATLSKLISASLLAKKDDTTGLILPSRFPKKLLSNASFIGTAAILIITLFTHIQIKTQMDSVLTEGNHVTQALKKKELEKKQFLQTQAEINALEKEYAKWVELTAAKTAWKKHLEAFAHIFNQFPLAWIETLSVENGSQPAIILETRILTLGQSPEVQLKKARALSSAFENTFGKNASITHASSTRNANTLTLVVKIATTPL